MEIDDLEVAVNQARLALAAGNIEDAARWARGRGLDFSSDGPDLDREMPGPFLDRYHREAEYLILARICLAEGQAGHRGCHERALELLAHLQTRAETQGHGWRLIEVLILRALALQALGETTGAAGMLDGALALAGPEGYVRVFLDEGAFLETLLRDAVLHGTQPRYARTLLEAMGMEIDPRLQPALARQASLRNTQQPLVEPLSKRELEILSLLTTSLSSTEIAGHLYVSVNTIRSHIRHIYGKLDVHSRIEAITRAQELQLI
jgi:LuxR family maltose regulon positive regulatory protein